MYFSLEPSGTSKGKRATRLFDPESLCQHHTVVKCTQRTWSCMAFVWYEGSWAQSRLLDLAQQGEEFLHSRLVVINTALLKK